MFICINYSLLKILHPLTVGSWKVALIVYSVCPMNCFIFQMNCSLSGLYLTVPVSLYYLFTLSTLKEGFWRSNGTGIIISTLLAIDLSLKFVFAFTMYIFLVAETSSIFTSTHIRGLS